MLKCWEENPDDRPTFAKLKDTMKDMKRNHKVNSVIRLISIYFVAYAFVFLAVSVKFHKR